MKVFALSLFAAFFATIASAAPKATIPDCYTQNNVVKGQFIVMLEANLDRGVRHELIKNLGALELSVINSFGSTLLVERTALSMQSREEELAVLKGLAKLVGHGAKVITCNGLAFPQ